MKESLVFALSLTMFPACTTHSQTLRPESEIYDGFEARDLSDIWNTSKFEPGAVVIQSEMVRAGKSAAKITIRQGDRYDAADPSTKENERDERPNRCRCISMNYRKGALNEELSRARQAELIDEIEWGQGLF